MLTKVSLRLRGHMTVSNDRPSRQIVRVSLAAVKQREIGTTVIIGLCVPLIHSLAYTDTHADPVSGKIKPSDKVWESAGVLWWGAILTVTSQRIVKMIFFI